MKKEVDRRVGLSASVAAALHDPRHPDLITHDLRHLVAQRLYGLCSLCQVRNRSCVAELPAQAECADAKRQWRVSARSWAVARLCAAWNSGPTGPMSSP